MFFLLTTLVAQGQISIGGNVYGGGNKGKVGGSTSVTVKSGDLNKVFGGARMADVGGNAYVHIDGENATGYMVINYVFGGNDIAGHIGTAAAVGEDLPDELTENRDGVDNTWNTYVRISSKLKTDNVYYTAEEATAYNTAHGLSEGDSDYKTIYHIKTPAVVDTDNKKIFIGQLFAGGNGDYYYPEDPVNGNYEVYNSEKDANEPESLPIASNTTGFNIPELDKTYLDIQGGTIAFVHGGGNNATVREKAIIHVDNPSDVVTSVTVDADTRVEVTANGTELLTDERIKDDMGIRMAQEHMDSPDFQMGRFFGGNNKAEMAIRPTWNLQRGKIRNLYSGGNRGNMTSTEGLLLEINPDVSSSLVVDNVYGGCRMADVIPMKDGEISLKNLPGYKFPSGLSARVLVRSGNINNVFGGNDVTGTVYGGNAVGIYTSIGGDVYGGGNGAYAYTDMLEDDDTYGDFYYPLGEYTTSTDALNAFRPNAEQVSIRLKGKSASEPTIIKGRVFVGGNCATISSVKDNPLVELKIGSYVVADQVFLGNNGEKMVAPEVLKLYAGITDPSTEQKSIDYSTLQLTEPSTFSSYMEGVAMSLKPSIVFDNINDDPAEYEDYTSYIGSFYCGGNVGSMAIPGNKPENIIYKINRGLNIFDKFVGGCNNANVEEGTYNAAYKGGVLGALNERGDNPTEFYTDTGAENGQIKDRLQIDLENLTITPLRWNDSKTGLIWNTNKWDDEAEGFVPVPNASVDGDTRLLGGNIYGGCYNSGHVNGNVIININEDVLKRDEVFGNGTGRYGNKASGVDLESQRDDLEAVALSVFGAGYGEDTEIWGSTTVNLNKGYALQVYGGGEKGVVGKNTAIKDENGHTVKYEYYFNPAYSTTVNLKGASAYSETGTNTGLAEAEYLYGGGNEGKVCGNTTVNLGNGLIYDAFGGASNADILGHTEVYIGRQPDGSGYKDAFPWVRDIVYGGNDFGGIIHGEYEDGYDFTSRVRDYDTNKASLHGSPTLSKPGVLRSASYVEYLQGRVDTIFGGNYGYYDYKKEYAGLKLPYLSSSFVNIRPNAHDKNYITGIYGGGTGYPKNREGDNSQDRSYVLIDIPDNEKKFQLTEVFGAGSYNGVGMGVDKSMLDNGTVPLDSASTIIDLLHGQFHNVYGGSYNEGNTRRTVVNVPAASTIVVDSIFGGAYGTQILPPCDVYESHVNYRNTNEGATVRGAIFGGNNNERRTLYTEVNISSPVWSNKDKGYLAKVYGAGRGIDTWSEYTEVNLEKGAKVYEVYGGGEMGHVLNAESVQQYMYLYKDGPSHQIGTQDPYWKDHLADLESSTTTVKEKAKELWDSDWEDAWKMGQYYAPNSSFDNYVNNTATNLTNKLVREADMDDRDYTGYTSDKKDKQEKKYNTNVIINEGATVVNYAYGGGYGDTSEARTGDVYGSTYIALLGGTVIKDIYAAGTSGSVDDLFGVRAYNATSNTNGFTASANAYVKGGSCRNVYGGGWLGNVGKHVGNISDTPDGDIPGETHVVIGDLSGTSFTSGIPTIQRNAYGGGEGGAVYGTAYLTLNNGYVGYQYNSKGTDNEDTKDIDERYEEKIEDDTQAMPNTKLTDAGCLFGGGYIDNSYVDKTRVYMYGGHVRNSIFGGGEIAAIGRGSMSKTTTDGKTTYSLAGLYRPGKTNIEMYGGHVHRNVFGGGRGYDNLGNHGSLFCDGYVFGQTEVHIHGGEIGTNTGVADGDGNVFGGGDIGYVYSAYEDANGTFGRGMKVTGSERYKDVYQGYYFKHKWDDTSTGDNIDSDGFYTEDVTVGEGESATTTKERMLTEDCKVLVEPHMKVLTDVPINGTDYKAGQYVSIADLNTLKNKETDAAIWERLDDTGIIIHNAVFAGGNTPVGSLTTNANTASVFGNATASIHDIYHRDMITLGTRHTGGLYGDGNLTLVDGYRELNITNYGTDYYSIAKEITIDKFHALPKREADYYELKYTCNKECKDKDGTLYKVATQDPNGFTTKASTITADELQSLFVTTDKDGNKVSVKDGESGPAILKYDETKAEWIPNPDLSESYWVESGVLPVYAGRLMNSIQRADLCGVWGSRMVMQGAQDRVPEEADYTDYTINRVREVSLNKKKFKASDPETTTDFHGNYFGIYNVVNYLGALTSDVDFGDETSGAIRTTDNTDAATYKCAANDKAYETATFYDWKKEFSSERKRNNGNSYNKVALASGVYLEITSEESTGPGLYEKVWGPITGVVELDLINVSTGIGGGFVYAKNQHGVRTKTDRKNTTLTNLNLNAVTQWDYDYATADGSKEVFETSGNFVHSTQTIIDDCYNISNRYKGDDAMPAHFWYIKGSTYVYDQYISAYTGVPNAYSESVDIPLTIAAASHGKMKLLNVMPNRYAYYSSPGVKLQDGKKVIINDKTYYKNDPISYWDWYLLSNSEKGLFVEQTYVNCITCKIDGTEYAAGTYVMTKGEFDDYKEAGDHSYTNAQNETIKKADNTNADDDYIFRSSNIVSHDTGYILTYEVNNPSKWDNWFTPKSGDYKEKKTLAEYEALNVSQKANYNDGPTYRLKDGISAQLIGRREYGEGELISKETYDTYQAAKKKLDNNANLSDSAHFEKAYIVTSMITVTENDIDRHYNPGTTVSKTFADSHSGSCEEAYICTNTVQVTKEDIIYKDSKMTKTQADGYVTDVKGKMNTLYSGSGEFNIDQVKALATTSTFTTEKKKELTELAILRDQLKTYLVSAYYCKSEGLYGGNYYETGVNYRGLEAWSSLTEEDHEKFIFNYDALDLLIDPDYTTAKSGAYSEGHKYQYDGAETEGDAKKNLAELYTAGDPEVDGEEGSPVAGDPKVPGGYSIEMPVDYTATYNGSKDDKTETVEDTEKKYMEVSTSIVTSGKVYVGDELSREVFEALPNEQRHYAPVVVENGNKTGEGESTTYTVYVVNTAFQVGSTPYAVGETISYDTYRSLPETEQTNYISTLVFGKSDEKNVYYFCRDSYKIATGGHKVQSVINVTGSYDVGATVPVGAVIAADNSGDYTGYSNLSNQQRNFTIHGISPTETSTLYVSRESNIYDLSKEKIITVIYQYDYDETDGQGNVTPISERHVVNIHLSFKSGVPTVADIDAPPIILPGDFTSLREPTVTPGAYEVLGGGWELFETEHDAESHSNGIEYNPNFDPLYWYQDGFYVSYYAKSYAGRTYSNYVPVKVANYHDLAEVMSDANKEHHMYIDNKNVKRYPKIYINDYSGSGKNGLDLFKNLYDLSMSTTVATSGALKDHALLNNRVKAGDNLEFFLRTDIKHPGTWTPIGSSGSSDSPCENSFLGTLHGDGHTISGLAPATGTTGSLFGYLCGSVYNLGVTGSFTGSGVADAGAGYVESCWVKTSATSGFAAGTKAVFGGSDSVDDDVYQTVNSYYYDGNKGADDTSTTGYDPASEATPMSEHAFYNGELAYNLNNFYLYKRYGDKTITSGEGKVGYRYFTIGNDNEPVLQPMKYYDSNPAYCSSGYIDPKRIGLAYVEDRFEDGDFRYAANSIPADEDERYWQETVTNNGKEEKEDHWLPIWPDDYIFFGQKLNYGFDTESHQDVPTAVVRDGGRLDLSDTGNRVYRAPAYFRSSSMGAAYFNPNAYLAIKSADGKKTVYPKMMTAIDFAGHNASNEVTGSYGLGSVNAQFYPPLLDDDGLTAITNCNVTKNLLVYAPAATAESGYTNEATHVVLTDYFIDPEYADYYDNGDGYRLVNKYEAGGIRGHLVQSDLTATNDHLLVDKEDFNAPISYTFDSSHRMWYQRTPEDHEFVDHNTGWQDISLPFTAELVTTHQKGEITHFYSGSEMSKNGTGKKIGHEYWLRNLTDMTKDGDDIKGDFVYPTATGSTKTVTNKFLWDYYYQNEAVHNQKDANADTYQNYYSSSRSYPSYPLLTGATPYILGLPGETYYEFDLSGNFIAENTASTITKLTKQTVTFASNTGITIGVSDKEMEGFTKKVDGNTYAYRPSYMNETFTGTGAATYAMNTTGNAYDKITAEKTVGAFRPYFIVTSTPSESRPVTRSIVFTNNGTEAEIPRESKKNEAPGTLSIHSGKHKIVVSSDLNRVVTVNIFNANGITMNTFDIKPGDTIETRIINAGVYIVQTTDGKFLKKLAVR